MSDVLQEVVWIHYLRPKNSHLKCPKIHLEASFFYYITKREWAVLDKKKTQWLGPIEFNIMQIVLNDCLMLWWTSAELHTTCFKVMIATHTHAHTPQFMWLHFRHLATSSYLWPLIRSYGHVTIFSASFWSLLLVSKKNGENGFT